MNHPWRPFLAMLLWQFIIYAVVSVPLLVLITWAYRGGTVQSLQGGAAALLWGGGVLWSLFRLLAHVFHNDGDGDATPNGTTGVIRMPAWLKLPRKFSGLMVWSFHSSLFALLLVSPPMGLVSPHIGEAPLSETSAAMTVFWLSILVPSWGIWALGRFPHEPSSDETQEELSSVDLIRSPGPEEPPHTLRWRASVLPVTGATVSRLLRDVLRTNFLPPITGGERRWEVAVDGEPIAVLTQTWTDAEWWPEPEWLVDPDTPFTGEQIAFTRRESQAR